MALNPDDVKSGTQFDSPIESVEDRPIETGVSDPVIHAATAETPVSEAEPPLPVADSAAASESLPDEVDMGVVIVDNPFAENIFNSAPTDSELDPGEDPDDFELALPSRDRDHVKQINEKLPKIGLTNSEADRRWATVLTGSNKLSVDYGVYSVRLMSMGSSFTNQPMFEKTPLTMGVPRFSDNKGAPVTGERAIERVKSMVGVGTKLSFPLWNSGFWVTIRRPSDPAYMDLVRRVGEAKINLGRDTSGIALSSETVYTDMMVVDLFLDCVVDVSINADNINLREHIALSDMDTIRHALATVMKRRGFKFARACMADPTKCRHVVTRRANAAKLLHVDWNALDVSHHRHMSHRGGSTMTLESVKTYRQTLKVGGEREVVLNEGLVVVLDVPVLQNYFIAGQRWINGIISMVDATFTDKENEAARNTYITENATASILRRHAHWVKAIVVDETRIEDRDTIDELLETLSIDESSRNQINLAILKYIEDSTVSITGIYSMICPSCQKEMGKEHPRFPKIIPYDMAQAFFILAAQYNAEIQARSLILQPEA